MNLTVKKEVKINYCECEEPDIYFETIVKAFCNNCKLRIEKVKLMRFRDQKSRILTKRYHEYFKLKEENFSKDEVTEFLNQFSDVDKFILTWILKKGAKDE